MNHETNHSCVKDGDVYRILPKTSNWETIRLNDTINFDLNER